MALLAVYALSANAQNGYEVVKLFDPELSGTARYVSMGGSMSALGTDVSVMSVNPAGIGLYRSNDVAVTLGLTSMETESNSGGRIHKKDKSFLSIDNAGIVFSNINSQSFSDVEFINVGLAYKHSNNLKREFLMAGATDGFSQMYQIQRLYDCAPFDISKMSYRDYENLGHSWLALLAADGGLLDWKSEPQGELLCGPSTNMEYGSEERGGVDQVDFNISCNVSNRVYLGLTLGFYNVDYQRSSYYGEDDADAPIYTLYNEYATEGAGFDIKLGTIIRPFEESSFRFGLAVHTPTWYSLTDRMSCEIYGPGFPGAPYDGYMSTLDYQYAYGDVFCVDYHLVTPWRFNVSAATTIGNFFAINAEYEYADYSTAKMKTSNGGRMDIRNEEIKSNMKGVNNFRIGAEFKIDKNFSLRAGYNYVSAPYKKEAAKTTLAFTDTNTEYQNSLEQHNYTFGLGYRGKIFYFDAAYVLSERESDFYPFYDTYDDEYGNIMYNAPTTVKDTKNRFVVTAGVRF